MGLKEDTLRSGEGHWRGSLGSPRQQGLFFSCARPRVIVAKLASDLSTGSESLQGVSLPGDTGVPRSTGEQATCRNPDLRPAAPPRGGPRPGASLPPAAPAAGRRSQTSLVTALSVAPGRSNEEGKPQDTSCAPDLGRPQPRGQSRRCQWPLVLVRGECWGLLPGWPHGRRSSLALPDVYVCFLDISCRRLVF